jgi:hypothetical protein
MLVHFLDGRDILLVLDLCKLAPSSSALTPSINARGFLDTAVNEDHLGRTPIFEHPSHLLCASAASFSLFLHSSLN